MPVPLTARSMMVFNTDMNAGVVLWARREIRRGWSSLALLALLIALGGGAAVAAVAAANRTDTAFHRMLRATNQPNLEVFDAGETQVVLDPARLDRVLQLGGVIGASTTAGLAVAPDGFDNFFQIAIVDTRGEGLTFIPIEGVTMEHVDALAADEVLVNEAMRDQLGKAVGDTVVLRSLMVEQAWASVEGNTEIVPGGPTVHARIAGVFRTPEDVSDAPDPFIALTPAFYEKYHDAIGTCCFQVSINADPRRLDAVSSAVAEIYPGAEISPAEDFPSRIADTVSLQRRAWLLIAATAALAGVVSLLQAGGRVGRLLAASDDARRALGMTQRDLWLGRVLVIVPATVAGSLGALGVAYALTPLAPVGLTKLAEPAPGFRWDPAVVVPGTIGVMLTSAAVAAVSVVATGAATGGRRAAGLGGPQLALGSRQALGPGRGAVVGVMLATAGLVGALTLDHSLHRVLATPALFGADFDASNMLTSIDDKRALAEQLVPDPDVEAVALVWAGFGTSDPVPLVGPGGEAEVDPKAFESLKGTVSIGQTQGRRPRAADEVAVGRNVMRELGVKIGDRISATGGKGMVQLTIVGDNLDPGVDVAGNGFALTLDGLATLVDPTIEGTVARFAPGSGRSALTERYSALGFSVVSPPSEVGHIGQLGGLPMRIGQLLAGLGMIALVNAVVLTVRLGRRELAIHRALGFTRAQVLGAYLWQGALTAFVGVAVGGGAGFVIGRAIDRKLVQDVGAIPVTVLPPAVWVVAAAAFAASLCSGAIAGTVALRRRSTVTLRAE